MHLCKYVHRDISSENILLVASSEPSGGRGVIMGLEYAKKVDDKSARHGVKMGIAAFMATEVAFMEHFRLKELRVSPVCLPGLPNNAELPSYHSSKPLPPFRYNPLHDLESIWCVCVWIMLYLAPAGRNSAVQLKNHHRVFRNKHSRHDFICHPLDFVQSTTHLEETPSVVQLMKIWAQSLNYYYGESYMQQDASETHLTRIRIDDKTIEAAYNRGNDILERLKQACESLSTHFVTLAECSYDETSTATTQQSTSNTSASGTESSSASSPALMTKRQMVKPVVSTARRRKNGPPEETPKGPKRGISAGRTKKQKGKLPAKATSGEPDFWIELPPVRKKARRAKPNVKPN
ncbi:unnamed protein product [Rhizoctonia solani]|uniref:Fungal-type protein kinase domain-containing protein n=1 Tax=Rhizoctonia solani TaxID=456999 RepID=A0A8H3HQY9_9AGAM|nr:unnamed protein product [Rhizoctonia solani]